MNNVLEEFKKVPKAVIITVIIIVAGIINYKSLDFKVIENDTIGGYINTFFYLLAVILPYVLMIYSNKQSQSHWLLKIIRFTVLGTFSALFALIFGSQSYFHFGDRVTIWRINKEIITFARIEEKEELHHHGTFYKFKILPEGHTKSVEVPVNKINFDTLSTSDTLRIKLFSSTGEGLAVKFGDIVQP